MLRGLEAWECWLPKAKTYFTSCQGVIRRSSYVSAPAREPGVCKDWAQTALVTLEALTSSPTIRRRASGSRADRPGAARPPLS